jgi:hypothetical protein
VSARVYDDRSLAVTDHAVERFRERTGAVHMDVEDCRRVIAQAVKKGTPFPHYMLGQNAVRVDLLGTEVFAIVGPDLTGWSKSGRAVITVLTQKQLEASWERRS